MDPAGPSFEDTNPIIRVDPTDADFVDIMHTNGGNIVSASYGYTKACGYVSSNQIFSWFYDNSFNF